MNRMKLVGLIAVVASGLMGLAASAAPIPSAWDQPAAELCEQIGNLLGPGQARLTIRNLSTIPADEVPAIQRLLEQDLNARGVLSSGADSANALRVTLSENAWERLWVAEVILGNETRVAMVQVDRPAERAAAVVESIVLRKARLPMELSYLPGGLPDEPVIASLSTDFGMVLLRPDEIALFMHGEGGWSKERRLAIKGRLANPRDARGLLIRSADGRGFTAFVPGTECRGSDVPQESGAAPSDGWTMQCQASDDPWPLVQPDATTSGSPGLKAFYNSARNYFTGVVTPNLGVDLPPFYSAALIPRPAANAALLIGGIDGKVLLVENGAVKPVAGARDWGSDFSALHSGCGTGTQIVASGSGEAITDSLRAYELPAQEAVPMGAPLAMDGTVTALWAAPDGKSVIAVVRGSGDSYEVDRVTADCHE